MYLAASKQVYLLTLLSYLLPGSGYICQFLCVGKQLKIIEKNTVSHVITISAKPP